MLQNTISTFHRCNKKLILLHLFALVLDFPVYDRPIENAGHECKVVNTYFLSSLAECFFYSQMDSVEAYFIVR